MDGAARETEMDFGPRDGTARVTVRDPCATDAARQRRREALAARCAELLGQGLLQADGPERKSTEKTI